MDGFEKLNREIKIFYCYVGKVKSTSANFPKAERHYSQSP
jgi:hypothetical protein